MAQKKPYSTAQIYMQQQAVEEAKKLMQKQLEGAKVGKNSASCFSRRLAHFPKTPFSGAGRQRNI